MAPPSADSFSRKRKPHTPSRGVNVGVAPTFAGKENPEVIAEGHLIGYEGGDFYGRALRLLLTGYRRPEKKFEGLDELVAAINRDIEECARWLETDQNADHIILRVRLRPDATSEWIPTTEAWWARYQ